MQAAAARKAVKELRRLLQNCAFNQDGPFPMDARKFRAWKEIWVIPQIEVLEAALGDPDRVVARLVVRHTRVKVSLPGAAGGTWKEIWEARADGKVLWRRDAWMGMPASTWTVKRTGTVPEAIRRLADEVTSIGSDAAQENLDVTRVVLAQEGLSPREGAQEHSPDDVRQLLDTVSALDGILDVTHVTKSGAKYILHLQDGNQVEVMADSGSVQVDVLIHAGSADLPDANGDLLAVANHAKTVLAEAGAVYVRRD